MGKAADLPQDDASKASRAKANSLKRHVARKTFKPAFPNRAKPAKGAARRDHSDRPLTELKKQIKVFKRVGGTVQFARNLKKATKAENVRRTKNSIKICQANKAAKEAAKGDETKAKKVKKVSSVKTCHMRKVYQTQLPMRLAAAKGSGKQYKRTAKLHKTLVPGTVCILLAGRHQSKKCVFLKQLKRSGLCLITGPFGLNKVPLRRMDQQFMQATSVRLPLPVDFKVPGHVDDAWFKKKRGTKNANTTKASDAMLTSVQKLRLRKPDASRKKAQRFIDDAIMKSFRQHKDKMIKKYMIRPFGLIGDRYAHNLKF